MASPSTAMDRLMELARLQTILAEGGATPLGGTGAVIRWRHKGIPTTPGPTKPVGTLGNTAHGGNSTEESSMRL
jgi:hypothetical protein